MLKSLKRLLLVVSFLSLLLFHTTQLHAAQEAAPDFSKGMLLFSDSNYKEAAKSFEQAYKIDPKSDDTLYMLSLTEMKLENYPKAAEHFKTLLDRNPGYTKAYQDYGISLYVQGKYQEAIPVFDKATEAEPKNPQPRFYQGLAYYFSGDKEQSLATLNRIATQYPNLDAGKNAQAWIEKIESGEISPLQPKESKWSLVGAASFFYDSNVSLDPDAEDVAEFQTNQAEIMGTGALSVRYRLWERDKGKIYLGFNGYQTAYADKVLADVDMNRFNYGNYTGGVDWHYLISEKVQFRLPIFFYYSILGASRYVQSGVGDAALDVAWDPQWPTTFMGEIRRDDFYANPSNVSQNRDALKMTFSGEQYFFFPQNKNRYLKVGYKFEDNFAEGADWDYVASHILFASQNPLFWKLNFLVLADIIPLRKFKHVDSVYGVQRGDFTYTASGTLSREIIKHLSLSLNYTYYKSASNIPSYTYSRQLAGLTLTAGF